MEENVLREYVEQKYSQREIAKLTGKSQCSVRHWLNKYGIKTKYYTLTKDSSHKHCSLCKETLTIDHFYTNGNRLSSRCKACNIDTTRVKQQEFKAQCVTYKGGSCIRCGYDRYVGALEFHHNDPTEKDFEISKVKSKCFNESIKKELDKCDLLCSNCHKEVHNEIYTGR